MKVKIYLRWVIAAAFLGAVTTLLWEPETIREWIVFPICGSVFWGAMLTPMLNAEE